MIDIDYYAESLRAIVYTQVWEYHDNTKDFMDTNISGYLTINELLYELVTTVRYFTYAYYYVAT